MPETDAFDLDAFIAEQDLRPFKVKTGKKTLSLPHFNKLPAEQALAIATGGSFGERDLREVLAEISGEDNAAVLFKLPIVGFNEILRRWQDHAGVGQGESPASSSSSESAAGPSNVTSNGSTAPTSDES